MKIDFSEFHPLDHNVLQCRDYPGGRRRHVAYRWEFQIRDRIHGRLLHMVGRHDWRAWAARKPEKDPDITRGTLEGRIRPGEITIFRLQSTADTQLRSYIAQGEILDIDPRSFGGIGVFAIPEMGRFYRHVLIEKRFPHHTAVAFKHVGKPLFEAVKMLGVQDVFYNLPENVCYATENPF